MSSEIPIAADDLVFTEGFTWDRGFVKCATIGGRAVSFRISSQLVSRCLIGDTGVLDPVNAFTANEAAVRAACKHALKRAEGRPQSSFDVRREDFE
jgi:hypothetical protein